MCAMVVPYGPALHQRFIRSLVTCFQLFVSTANSERLARCIFSKSASGAILNHLLEDMFPVTTLSNEVFRIPFFVLTYSLSVPHFRRFGPSCPPLVCWIPTNPWSGKSLPQLLGRERSRLQAGNLVGGGGAGTGFRYIARCSKAFCVDSKAIQLIRVTYWVLMTEGLRIGQPSIFSGHGGRSVRPL